MPRRRSVAPPLTAPPSSQPWRAVCPSRAWRPQRGRGASTTLESKLKDTNQGAEPIHDETLDQVSAGSAGKVSYSDLAAVKGDPSQWGVQVYKKGSFDITE